MIDVISSDFAAYPSGRFKGELDPKELHQPAAKPSLVGVVSSLHRYNLGICELHALLLFCTCETS